MQQHPAGNPDAPDYRRLRDVRYAADFLLGLAGPQVEAEESTTQLAEFLSTTLQLTLATEKTRITHASTNRARFLGDACRVRHSQTRWDARKRRSVNGTLGLYIPESVIQTKRKRYFRDGKAIHRPERYNDSEYDSISR